MLDLSWVLTFGHYCLRITKLHWSTVLWPAGWSLVSVSCFAVLISWPWNIIPQGPKWSDFDIDMQIKISYLTFHQLKNQDGITDWKFSFWILNSCFSILVQLQHKVWVVKLSWSRRLGSLLNSSVVLIVVSLKSESIFFLFENQCFTTLIGQPACWSKCMNSCWLVRYFWKMFFPL